MNTNNIISKKIIDLDEQRHLESSGTSEDGHTTLYTLPQGIQKSWEIYTLIDAYKPRPPITYIVNRLFPIPSFSIVFGAPGCLKSFLLADMAMCIAAGLPFLLPQSDIENKISGIKTIQSPVLWMDFDNGKRTTHERFDALGKAYGLPATTPLHYISMPDPSLDASNQDSLILLDNAVTETKAKFVVIDNLSLISGKKDENSSEMTAVMSNLRNLCENHDIALEIIHHQRKSNGTRARKGETLRGHSSIEAALDLVLHIERIEHSNMVTIMSTKVRGPDVDPFSAKFVYKSKDDSNELASGRFYGVGTPDNNSRAAICKGIKKAVLATPDMNKSTLVKKVKEVLDGVGEKTIIWHIEDLVAANEIQERQGPHNSKLFSMVQTE